jgi:hypothetical protein
MRFSRSNTILLETKRSENIFNNKTKLHKTPHLNNMSKQGLKHKYTPLTPPRGAIEALSMVMSKVLARA